MFRLVFAVSVAVCFGLGGPFGFVNARAQTDAPDAPPTLRSLLQKVSYDAAERGPLIVVAPDEPAPAPPTPATTGSDDEADAANTNGAAVPSLGALARRVDRLVVQIGGVTVLAPRQMMHIETDPAKANPFKNMQEGDTIKLLMGTLTPAQWQIAGSAAGIGIRDLDKDQQLLFDSFLPSGKIEVQKTIFEAGAEPNSKISKSTEIPVTDRASIHLRLNRETQINLNSAAGNENMVGSDDNVYLVGQTRLRMYKYDTGDPSNDDNEPNPKFGVKLAYLIPNRQKPSQLDYSEHALDARISFVRLYDKATLGDIITRVAAATRIDVVPDRRVRNLIVYVRGDSARAGDLLQAIAFCVTGTCRRIGKSGTYLLTDDIEGIGVRISRLERWAEAAQIERQKVIDDAMKHAAGQHPLQYLAYAPGDPFALSPSLIARMDNDISKDFRAQDVPLSALPPAFQSAAQQRMDYLQSQKNESFYTSKVDVNMSLGIHFVIPGIGVVSGQSVGVDSVSFWDSLHELADAPDKAAPPDAPEDAASEQPSAAPVLDWAWLKAPKYRCALLIAPVNGKDANAFVAAAHRHYFKEVWMLVTLGNTTASREILQAAIATAKPLNMPVYAVVSLLQNNGLDGEPERNLLGQTGKQFVSAELDFNQRTDPDFLKSDYSDYVEGFIERSDKYYIGWADPSRDDLLNHVSALADTPGIAGLVFKGTAPPGFVSSPMNGGSGILMGGEMGYTDPRRIALVHAEGIDPIDVRPSPDFYLGDANIDLPFFPDQGEVYKFIGGKYGPDPDFVSLAQLWENFRVNENEALLRDVYGKIHTLRPRFPLLIDDRISDYVDAKVSWFGSWDSATRLPKNIPYSDPHSGATAAHTTAHSALFSFTIPKHILPEDMEYFAEGVSRIGAESASEKWDGIVFDFSDTPRDTVLHLLDTLPTSQ